MSEQKPTWAQAYKLADDWLMDDEAPFTQELGIELAETIIDLCGRIDLLEQERDALKAQIAADQRLVEAARKVTADYPPGYRADEP